MPFAFQFILPRPVLSLRTLVSGMDTNIGDAGDVSVQLADVVTGTPLPGVNTPGSFVGPATHQTVTALHTLDVPIPENTPFLVRMEQSGVAPNADYRFNCTVLISV